MDVFERERQEIIQRIERLYDEYNTSVMVWESKISFEPIVGHSYYLYEFKDGKTLSLISPQQWDKFDCFIGEYILTSERKWIKV
jgi:phage regulator Rha-like protein